MEIFIKNMVCARCERAVRAIFERHGWELSHLELGRAEAVRKLTTQELEQLDADFRAEGFSLARQPEEQLIGRIKLFVLRYLEAPDPLRTFSAALSEHFHADFGHLSRRFKQYEGRTLESYLIAQRIERAKAMLQMGELTISEIAYELGYRTGSHFSAQFKQVTGSTPSAYRKSATDRRPLDEL